MWLPAWLNPPNPPASAKRLKILAVSIALDDIVLIEYLGDQNGWETKFAGSPQEAFRMALEGSFDLILCDRNQAGYPWREVMDLLGECSPASCILLVSPSKDDHLWWDVLNHGGFDVLLRPLREDTVLRLIDSALRCAGTAASCPSD